MHSLVVIEHDGSRVKRGSLCAITLARQISRDYALLILGSGTTGLVESVRNLGALAVYVADCEALKEPLADRHAVVIARAATHDSAAFVLGTSSSYTKDVLPRVAALLDAAMLTDVSAVEREGDEMRFCRPAAAGTLRLTVRLEGKVRVLTAQPTAFAPATPNCALSSVEDIAVASDSLPTNSTFIQRESRVSLRPDPAEARVIVGGGRPLRDKETFERLIGGLADALGGAIGATRAAVDTGLAPNDCQIGQTGKTVAPELYFAVGVSGAIQHVAGIKDSKVIVAINRDPEAPIFEIANYGLVGDLHQIVPDLLKAVRA